MVIKHLVIVLALLPATVNGQVFEHIGLSTGINFTGLEWEYRLSHGADSQLTRSKEMGVGLHVYASTKVLEKKNWLLNTSLGWIRKNAMFRESADWGSSRVRYKLDYISWITLVGRKFRATDHFVVNVQVGPRVEYLLTPWDGIPYFAPNDDHFYYYHREADVRKLNIGLDGRIAFGWELEKAEIQLTVWKNINFNPIIAAKGLRDDGLGDEGFRYTMRDKTFGVTLLCVLSL
jgi:hypothetical protein